MIGCSSRNSNCCCRSPVPRLPAACECPQSMGSVRQRRFAGLLQRIDCPCLPASAFRPTSTRTASTPRRRGGFAQALVCGPIVATCRKQCIGATFDSRDFFLGMCWGAVRKRPGSALGVHGKLLPLVVEHDAPVRASQRAHTGGRHVLRRRRVVRLVDFHVSVATDTCGELHETGEPISRQWQQVPCVRLSSNCRRDLLLGRAVNPRVGNGSLPSPAGDRSVRPDSANVRPFSALFLAYLTPFSTLPLCSGV